MTKVVHVFSYEELRPLVDWISREAYPSEHHYPGIHAIVERLMQIKKESENDSNGLRTPKAND